MTRIDVERIARTIAETAPAGRAARQMSVVQARQWLIDEIEALRNRGVNLSEAELDMLQERLDSQLATRLNIEVHPPRRDHDRSTVTPGAPVVDWTREQLHARVTTIVADAFSTTFDGSRARARSVARFARAEVDRFLSEERLSWRQRMACRRIARAAIANETKRAIF